VSGAFALQNGCSKLLFGQYCRGVLEHDAFHRVFRQSQVKDDISTQSFSEDPDPVMKMGSDVVQRIFMARHELTNGDTTMLWHDKYIISPQVQVIAQFCEDIRVTARPLRNQDGGSVLPRFKGDEFKLLAARKERSSLQMPFNLVRICFKNIILFPIALFYGAFFPPYSRRSWPFRVRKRDAQAVLQYPQQERLQRAAGERDQQMVLDPRNAHDVTPLKRLERLLDHLIC
jgi:hypothetical protein